MAERLADTTVPDPPSDELLHRVGLTRDEYQEACRKLGRKLNVVEMGIFGAMWSEHCCYKSSKRYLATFPTTGKRVLQGPGENAGVMDLGGGWAVVFKIESHNHPSAVEPFQGAATGIGGIIRDIFAMGARPIGLLDSLRFGNLRAIPPVGEPGVENGAEPAAEEAADEQAAPEIHPGVVIPWLADPPPFVCTVAWLTNMRAQVFDRAPAARRAVEEIRRLHGEMAEVLAYCVLPDQIQLALRLPGSEDGEEGAAAIVNMLKASLGELGEGRVKRNQPVWETGFRLHRKFDQLELDEAIKRLEYSPVQRGLVSQIKEYPHVSAVWRFGVAWPEEGAELAEEPQQLPFCPGVTDEQAARNRFLLAGVVNGIAHYGNCIGIPTVGGEVDFDPSYSSNCLVNAMCVGVARSSRLLKGIAAGPGNTALIVGAKTGRDGVQGATFASVDLPEDYAKERPAVQVGDPFMEKLLLEATLEIMHLDGLVGLQDFGAAGLTCSSVEMAARAGTGMRLDLDQVPQRASDLSAYEMMLSESQERMMVVVEKGKEQPFLEVFKKWGLTAVECGEVLQDKQLIVTHQDREVARLPNVPLADEAPDYDRAAEAPARYLNRKPLTDADIHAALNRISIQPEPRLPGAELPAADSRFEDLLRRLLASPAIASKYPVYRQYDHMVRTNTLAGPELTDAAVLRIKETGQGLAIATDCSARHVHLDPALGGARAVLEAARNLTAVGAEPLGITNCLNFGNPERPDRMWQFAQNIAGMCEALTELDLPVTGGNVSFYNESGGRSVLPTPVIGMVGLLDDATQYVPNRVTGEGLELYVLGRWDGRLDGSALLFDLGRTRAGELTRHNYRAFRECQRFIQEAARQRALAACHDISDGGLLTALCEMCPSGASIDVGPLLPEGYDNELHNQLAALFGEEGHRWLIAVGGRQRGWVRTAALHYSVNLIPLGTTTDRDLTVKLDGELLFGCDWEPLARCHREGLAAALAG